MFPWIAISWGRTKTVAQHIRDFARGRRTEKPAETPNRLYAVEALMTLTGGSADHRLRLSPGQVGAVAAHLAVAVLTPTMASEAAELLAALSSIRLPSGVGPEWVKECAADLLEHRGSSVLLAGHRQPLAVAFARQRHEPGAGQ